MSNNSGSSIGAERIAAERQRQIDAEGYDHAHDDAHTSGSIAWAAVCYAAPERVYRQHDSARGVSFADPWPWDARYDKRLRRNRSNVPTPATHIDDRVDDLVRAGALIAAEIDRLTRTFGDFMGVE